MKNSMLLKLKHWLIVGDEKQFDATLNLLESQNQVLNQSDRDGNTLLHWCCLLNKPDYAEKLLAKGAAPALQNNHGKTPLHKALERYQLPPESLIDVILPHVRNNSSLDVADLQGRTILHVASTKGFTNVVKKLLDCDAIVDIEDSRGWTSLHFATFYNRDAVCRLLLSRDTSPNDVNKDGWSSLHAAATQGHDSILAILTKEYGADVNVKASNGQTPLHVACINGHISSAKFLAENDADIKIPDKSGLTPLGCASKQIRSALRKTESTVVTDPNHTTIVGLPHVPIAEKDAKIAIQARDSWNRRRTHGGDRFTVSVSILSDSIAPVPPPQDMPKVEATRMELQRRRSSSIPSNSQDNSPTRKRASTNISPSSSSNVFNNTLSGSYGSIHGDSSASTIPDVIQEFPDGNELANANERPPVSNLNVTDVRDQSPPSSGRSPGRLRTTQAASTPVIFLPKKKEKKSRHSALIPSSSLEDVSTANQLPKTIECQDQSNTFIKDLENGLYIVRWKPLQAGTYQIDIRLNETPIYRSPYVVVVQPSRSPTLEIRTPSGSLIRSAIEPARENSDDSVTRASSQPIDLLSNLKPDMSVKPLASLSSPSMASKKSKSKIKPTVITVANTSAVSTPSSTESIRKRSSSTSSKATPALVLIPTNRDRSTTTTALTPNGKVPTTAPARIPEDSGLSNLPASPSSPSAQTDRSIGRMTSNFTIIQPLPKSGPTTPTSETPLAPANDEVAQLEATVSTLNKQIADLSIRLQDMETQQLVTQRETDHARASDRQKMIRLAEALRAERDGRLCKSCKQVSKNAIAVPCLHMSLCSGCIEQLEQCNVCNAKLKGFISAVLPNEDLPITTPR